MTTSFRKLATLLLLVVAATGCTTCQELKRTVFQEPKEFNWKKDAKESRELYDAWATEAWCEVGLAEATCTNSAYVWGFHVGFADYVFAGGTGEPPPVPPREFWSATWRADESGAADDWFAGYRHGATVARSCGYRDRALVRWSVANDASACCLGGALTSPCGVGRIESALLRQEEVVFPSNIDTSDSPSELLIEPKLADPEVDPELLNLQIVPAGRGADASATPASKQAPRGQATGNKSPTRGASFNTTEQSTDNAHWTGPRWRSANNPFRVQNGGAPSQPRETAIGTGE